MASLYAELLHALDLSLFYESQTKLRPGPRSNSEVLHLLDSKKPSTEDGQSWVRLRRLHGGLPYLPDH